MCMCVCQENKVSGRQHFEAVVLPDPLPISRRGILSEPAAVTFSGSRTQGPFSVTLCCHSRLVQPRQ